MYKILIIFLTYVSLISTQNICGNWESFKDEKCFKIISEEKLMTYEEAVQLCSLSESGSTLITIHSKEEQEFIAKYVFETRKIVENVWLALMNSSNSFEWIDKTSVDFTNWSNGSPSNKTDHKCVEMIADSIPIGKWFDIQCSKKNIAVCQRTPELTVSYLQKKLSETKELLKLSNDLVNKTTDMLNKTTNELKISQLIQTLSGCKNLDHSNLFTDSDGKQKILIFPLNENINITKFNEANNICIKYNASLVEINTKEKQTILEQFIKKIESKVQFNFWLNAHKDSTGKWKWLRSGNDFTFTNWFSGYPNSKVGYDYLYTYSGKWYNTYANDVPIYVFCEL